MFTLSGTGQFVYKVREICSFYEWREGCFTKNRLTKRKGIKKQKRYIMDLSEGLHRCIDTTCYVINWGGLYWVKLCILSSAGIMET